MEKLKNSRVWLVLMLAVFVLSCGEEGGLKGTLKIAITDAPIDADNVKAVNIVISNVEGFQNGKWKPFRYFEQPTGVNLLAYTGGKSVLLIDQYTNPGQFSSLRLSLNMAHRNSSLIVNPQSNIVFKDGSSEPIYLPEGAASEMIIEKSFGILSRGHTDLTIDIDVRKSIRLNDAGEYVLMPVVRVVNTNETGHIEMKILNKTISNAIVAYVYRNGEFSLNETTATAEGVSFSKAITSAAVGTQKVSFGFLEEGSYELIFVKHSTDGTVDEVLGKSASLKITPPSVTSTEIDLNLLEGS
jgi:hypothetical protein